MHNSIILPVQLFNSLGISVNKNISPQVEPLQNQIYSNRLHMDM